MTTQRNTFFREAGRMTDSIMRAVIVAAWLVYLFLATAPADALDRTPVALKAKPTAAGEYITLSDLFVDTGEAGGKRIATAPAPGERLALGADFVASAARKYGLYWANAGGAAHIVVSREAQSFSAADITGAVADALRAHGLGHDFDVRLSNANLSVHAPIDAAAELIVSDVAFDRANARFSAKVAAYDGGATATVAGRAVAVVSMPTLARPMMSGDVIARGDLDWMRLPASRTPHGAVTSERDIIGKALRRRINAGQPLRASDLEAPRIIEKGALVRMIYMAPGLKLTMVGRTLSDGGQGDLISVVNVQSHRTVQASVVSPDTVVVSSPLELAGL